MIRLLLASALCLPAWSQDKAKDDATLIKQDITIKAKAAAGPPVKVPAPGPDEAVLQEVIESLDVYRKQHRVSPPVIKLSETQKRLDRPFPEPPFLTFFPRTATAYDLWELEVLRGAEPVWKATGDGLIQERIEWDGTGYAGVISARVGDAFSFRFSGRKGKEEYLVASEPIELRSLAYKETMGNAHLEVDNALLFRKESALLTENAVEYLGAMGGRMRRVNPGTEPYRLVLYQDKPASRLAKDRSSALVKFLSRYLLVAPAKIAVEVRTPLDRGDVTACLLAAEPGDRINSD